MAVKYGVLYPQMPLKGYIIMQFCKRLLGVKKNTQNDFVYGELGRTNCRSKRYLLILKYWFKILTCPDNKHIKIVYKLMVNDMDLVPNKVKNGHH